MPLLLRCLTLLPAQGCKSWLIRKAVAAKIAGLSEGKCVPFSAYTPAARRSFTRADVTCGRYTHWLWDKIIFKNTKAILGGRCRLMVTGSAPIAGNVMDLLRIAMCCPLVEGYGQTECGAAATITQVPQLFTLLSPQSSYLCTQLGDTSTGHVGGPMPCNDVKLADVPEMNYVTNNPGGNPRGEVCFRGPNVFSGYFKVLYP